GVMKVMKVADKMFVGKSPLRVAVFRRDDQKVYNMVYRDGKSGRLYAKKFKIGGVTRDKEYPLFKTHSRSRIFFFSVHDTEKKNSRVLVHLDPTLKRIKEMSIEFDFAWLELQGRSVKGSTLTTHKVDRVVNAPKAEGEEADVAKPSPEVEKKKAKTDADEKEKAKPSAKPDQSKKEISSEKNGKPKDQATFDFKDN
ncbi:MAG: DNA topoisomerase, partial [Verrucomicrobiota bacterium]|nr:DNA topoisomerase [Verrucomicrobiota bacterium]